MIPFRATYTPIKCSETGVWGGLDDDKAETVLVIDIIFQGSDLESLAVFIAGNGELKEAPFRCFSNCQWKE